MPCDASLVSLVSFCVYSDTCTTRFAYAATAAQVEAILQDGVFALDEADAEVAAIIESAEAQCRTPQTPLHENKVNVPLLRHVAGAIRKRRPNIFCRRLA